MNFSRYLVSDIVYDPPELPHSSKSILSGVPRGHQWSAPKIICNCGYLVYGRMTPELANQRGGFHEIGTGTYNNYYLQLLRAYLDFPANDVNVPISEKDAG